MPKTTWRPNPFEMPLNKFENAARQRERIVEYMRRVGRPVTVKQVAAELGIGGEGYYGKAQRYLVQVADPTHEIHKPRHRPDIGWTLRKELK